MKIKNLVRNTMLTTGLVVVVILKLMLWPTKQMNKGLSKAGIWMLKKCH